MEIPEPTEINKENHGTLYLTISVFLVILSFFIMLNAISSNNSQKNRDITKSVVHEFTGKDLKQKIQLFDKNKYEVKPVQSPLDFKDIITSFTDSQQKNVSPVLSESPSNYTISVKINNVFGPDSPDVRLPAEAFLTSLNNYISLNRKTPEATAKLVLLYNDTDKASRSMALARIENLYATLDYANQRNISFSYSTAKNSDRADLANNIYILFDKNEF